MKEGDVAPDFILKDRLNQEHQLSKIKRMKVVYFYPKDSTQGCTIEAKEFSSILPKFEEQKTTIIGISGGDNKTKEKFCTEHNLKHVLLSDSDFSVSKKYDSYGEKSFMGRKYLGIKRNTFIIDKNNKIIHIYENVSALGHAKEVLSFIKNLK
jgi:peroxiredoxin Q/BCP